MRTLREYIDLVNDLTQERVSVDPETGKTTPSLADILSKNSDKEQPQDRSSERMPALDLPQADSVNREQNTLTFQGETYSIVKLEAGGPRPRGGRRIAVAQAQLGFRGIGRHVAILINDRAYLLPLGEQ